MTTPPTPPAPDPPSPPSPPTPPAPTPPAPAPPPPTAADLAKLQAALDAERQARKDSDAELAKLKAQGMTEAEKAIAAAREEGRAEATRAAALKLAEAEFRAQAAGKLAAPDAALAVLDLAKLLDKNGDPDKKRIGDVIGQLAVVPPPPGHIPTGPRQQAPANGDTDWIRAIRRPGR